MNTEQAAQPQQTLELAPLSSGHEHGAFSWCFLAPRVSSSPYSSSFTK